MSFSQNTLRITFKICSTNWPRTVACNWLQFLQKVEASITSWYRSFRHSLGQFVPFLKYETLQVGDLSERLYQLSWAAWMSIQFWNSSELVASVVTWTMWRWPRQKRHGRVVNPDGDHTLTAVAINFFGFEKIMLRMCRHVIVRMKSCFWGRPAEFWTAKKLTLTVKWLYHLV